MILILFCYLIYLNLHVFLHLLQMMNILELKWKSVFSIIFYKNQSIGGISLVSNNKIYKYILYFLMSLPFYC